MNLEILPLTTCGFSQDKVMLTLLVACPSKFSGGPGTFACYDKLNYNNISIMKELN